MKKCPQCNQFFDDENLFCLDDGTGLNNSDANDYSTHSGNTPTVFVPKFQVMPSSSVQNTAANSNKWLYPVLGILVGAVIVLGFLAFYPRPANEKENNLEKTTSITDNKLLVVQSSENKLQNSQKENTNVPPSEISTKQIESPPISVDAVRDLWIRWEKAQDMQSFRLYQSCYGQPFRGVKRVESETKVYNYASWLNDRRKVLGNAIGLDVEINNLQISIEGDTATAEFDQYYRSLRHSDWGPKILKLKMFPDGAKIVYEELKASYPLNSK